MSIDNIRKALSEGCDIVFEYNGKKCGVSPECQDSKFTFMAWCGENVDRVYNKLEDALSDRLYDDKSLAELAGLIEIDAY